MQRQKVAVVAPGAQIRIWTAAARYVRHGVAEDGSPRREPWGTMRPREKPRQGRQSWVQADVLSPLRGSNFQYPNPRLTPWATLLPLLRSILPQLSKRMICHPNPTALGLTAVLCAAILNAMQGRKIQLQVKRLSYRTCQVSAVLTLCAWAVVILAALVFPGGHPPLFFILLYYIIPATWVIVALGSFFGFFALADAKQRCHAAAFLIVHVALLVVSIAIWKSWF